MISARSIMRTIGATAAVAAIAACSSHSDVNSFRLVSTNQIAPLAMSAMRSDDQPPSVSATVTGRTPIYVVSGPRQQLDIPCVDPTSGSGRSIFKELVPETVVYMVDPGTKVTISPKPPNAGDIITIALPNPDEYGYTCALYFYPAPPAATPTP
jgi:hypothetical protein